MDRIRLNSEVRTANNFISFSLTLYFFCTSEAAKKPSNHPSSTAHASPKDFCSKNSTSTPTCFNLGASASTPPHSTLGVSASTLTSTPGGITSKEVSSPAYPSKSWANPQAVSTPEVSTPEVSSIGEATPAVYLATIPTGSKRDLPTLKVIMSDSFSYLS